MKHQQYVAQVNGSLVGKLFHQHLLIKAFVMNPPKKSEPFETWLKEIVANINMKLVAGPYSVYVDSLGNSGLTGGCYIETSHLAAHVWDEPSPAMIQFDVYSCSCFDPQVVLESMKRFGLVSYEYMLIDRNEGMKVIDSKVVDCE